MKKKVFTLLTIFLSAFFFCGINFVDASNLDINSYYSKFDTNLPIFLQNFDFVYNSCSSVSNLNNCFISTYGTTFSRVLYTNSMTLTPNWNNNQKKYQFEVKWTSENPWNTSTNSFGSCSRCNTNVYVNSYLYTSTQDGLIWAFNPVYYDSSISSIDTLTLPSFTSSVFNNCTIPSIVISNGDPMPTYYSLYHQYCEVPPDETPLLTSFYSLCIDKIGLVAEEFMTNYIYLAIITIFLFITILLIIKRRLF